MQNFICQTLKFPNYHLINQDVRLFEPRSIPVNELVFNKSKEVWGGVHTAWIGINDRNVEGEFVYESSREEVTVTDWYPSEPNSRGGNQDCVTFGCYYYTTYYYEKWDDNNCTTKLFFVCEILS